MKMKNMVLVGIIAFTLIVSVFTTAGIITKDIVSHENVDNWDTITLTTPTVSMDDVSMPVGGSNYGYLKVNDVSNLGSFSVNLSWNPSVVDVIGLSYSDFAISTYTDHVAGFINITGYSMSGVSGTYNIARLEFEAVGSAGDSCDLEIVYSQLLTADPQPVAIPHDSVDGTAQIQSTGNPTVVSMDDVSMPVGGSDYGYLKVNDVSNLGSFSVNLSWNPSVVDVISIGDSDFSIFNYTDHVAGFINITGYSASGVSGTYNIARLEFEAVGSAGDSCDLEIVYSQLLTADPLPNEINHEVINGTATILQEHGENNLTVEKSVKWDCTPPFVENVTANIGDYVTFRIYVNISDGEMFDSVIVHDVLPDGLSYIDGSTHITGITIPDEEPTIDGNVLTWEFSYLSDVSILIEFRANVILCGELVNYVNVTGTYCWQQTEFDEDTAIVWVPCAPGIVVDKQASLDGVNWVDDVIDVFVGDIVFFKINVSNTGDQVLDGVVVKDILPSFLTFNDDADPENIYYSVPDNEIRWFFSHIPVDEYRLITFSATVTETGIGENIAIVTTCGGPDADDSVTIDASGGMHVEKLVSLDGIHWVKNVTADVGDTVRFIINISYFTDDPTLTLFDFYIKDTLPDGLSYANDAYPAEPEIAGKTLYWNFTGDDDFMLSGDYLIIAFNATVVGDGEMINIVNVTARECSDTILFGEDEAIVYVEPGPSMSCEKTVQATDGSWVDEINANVGDTVRFNITISNIGYYPIYGIVVRDNLPSILTYVEDSAVIEFDGETNPYCMDYDVYDEENNTLFFDNLNFCTGVHLDPGENISLLFNAEVIAEGIGINFANVTACMCNQCDWQQCSDTAVVNVSTTGNHPPAASDPNPADGSTDVLPDDVTLRVTVIDNDDDTMNVSFYNASDDTLIKKVTGVSNESTASATWANLAHNITYTWYVIVDDSITTVKSATWSFTTEPEGVNHAPDAPYNPSPSNGANNVDRNPTLQVRVSDPDDDTLTVRFYDAHDDSLIGTDNNVASGSTASAQWIGLSASTSYSWYAKVSDSEFEVSSSTWSFTTEIPDIDLAIEIKGGIGVNAILKNNGDDDAENVDWSISVKNKGLLKRIDESNQGVVPVIVGNGDIVAKKLVFFGIGRVNVTVTVGCAECTTVTETADGIMIGFFVFITNH